jgi:hypothetical protein
MNKLWNALCSFGRWIRQHFDFALLLAAAVEIPRWTVTFLAIHEPLWVGIPLGALLAYATSEGWKAYFADPRRLKLLAFNVASLLAATFVITPVLFSMASAPIDEIDLAALLPFGWLLAWSAVLAVTTFAPLIQLAAVKSTPTGKTTESAGTNIQAVTPAETSVALPVGTSGHSGAMPSTAEQASATSGSQQAAAKATQRRQPAKRTANPNREQALHLRSEGFVASEIAGLLNEKESTVASWLYRGAQKNGVAK